MNRKNTANICKLLLLCLLLAAGGCVPSTRGGEEDRVAGTGSSDSLAFDPLALKEDSEVVPERYPADSRRTGETVTTDNGSAAEQADGQVDQAEPIGGQVFKVQVLSSKLFGEAKQAQRVAEEIFDQPVALDYEVPYFKVRVGAFRDRYEAERYSQRVRAAGYADAWVVAATISARKAAPMYQDGSQAPAPVDSTTADSSSIGNE